MNEMKIRISLYFEIEDSEMFGGEGSVGYAEKNTCFTVTEEKPRIFKESANMAKSLGVSEKCIRTINKEEYEENTGTEEEEL